MGQSLFLSLFLRWKWFSRHEHVRRSWQAMGRGSRLIEVKVERTRGVFSVSGSAPCQIPMAA